MSAKHLQFDCEREKLYQTFCCKRSFWRDFRTSKSGERNFHRRKLLNTSPPSSSTEGCCSFSMKISPVFLRCLHTAIILYIFHSIMETSSFPSDILQRRKIFLILFLSTLLYVEFLLFRLYHLDNSYRFTVTIVIKCSFDCFIHCLFYQKSVILS